MIWIIRSLLCRLLFGKGGELMMAMLWAQRIMSAPTLEEATRSGTECRAC